MTRKLIALLSLIFVVCLSVTQPALADYVIGIDDALEVTFWQAKDLNQNVVVTSDGKITLSVIGEITAAGLTTAQLSRKIVEQVSRINRDVSQATVVVTAYNSQTVFVEGEVKSPGRFAREVIPDIWTIIKEMGGTTDAGDLSNVRLIRGGSVDPGAVLTVDVLSAVRSKDFSQLPPVYPKDIIRVAAALGGVSPELSTQTEDGTRQVFYIIGAVSKPGVYKLDTRLDVMEAIALAGGTASGADLKNIKISAKNRDYANVYKVNLEKQLKDGSLQRYFVQAEDAIYIPAREGGAGGATMAIIRDLITFSSTITSTVLLIDRLGN